MSSQYSTLTALKKVLVLHNVILVCVVIGIILLLYLVYANGRILSSFAMQTRVNIVGNGHLRTGLTRITINKRIKKKRLYANES